VLESRAADDSSDVRFADPDLPSTPFTGTHDSQA
jgi:hypothetical protein